MKARCPHFLLFSEASRAIDRGAWRFLLQSADGQEQFEAADEEPAVRGERLELLAVIRGLEALPAPSRVTLVTPSRYVSRGLNYGLDEWRANDFRWERFGELVPIKNRDLWQRVDRALQFHEVACQVWRFDLPHPSREPAAGWQNPFAAPAGNRIVRSARRKFRRIKLAARRRVAEAAEAMALKASQLGTGLLPQPWLE